ncbi:MAG: bifunctional AAA family ATPase chaperone/translocase BCS1 [Harvfovirus sp.]|uniref:Bifunctional AAA family ATPase chaperone/translocase BCS1 n=1 Tax=Harvfovirus sp. TaxID=2487768 RepID=A0A3G5A1N7_9VIRU|nr:MAG: bifunctional AAA family ATPase chaperone/translocase BCS1 [Harvfovirus sp.]
MATGATEPAAAAQTNAMNPAMGIYGLKGYMDMMITNQIIGQMNAMMTQNKFDIGVVLCLVSFFFIDEIKLFFKKNLNSLADNGVLALKNLYEKLISFKLQRKIPVIPTEKLVIPERKKCNNLIINLCPTLDTIESLMGYIEKNKHYCGFKKFNQIEMKIENLNELILRQTVSDIYIQTKDFRIEIVNPLTLSYRKNKTKLDLEDYEYDPIEGDIESGIFKDIKSLTEMLEDDQEKREFGAVYKALKDRYLGYPKNEKMGNIATTWLMGAQKFIEEKTTAKYIIDNYDNPFKSIEDFDFFNEIFVMLALYQWMITQGVYSYVVKKYNDEIKFYCCVVFGLKIRFPVTGYSIVGVGPGSTAYFCEYARKIAAFQKDVNYESESLFINGTKAFKENGLMVKLSSPILNDSELFNNFNEIYDIITEHNEFDIKRDKVSMNYLSLERKVEIKETPNPGYEKYLERRKMMTDFDDDEDEPVEKVGDKPGDGKKNGMVGGGAWKKRGRRRGNNSMFSNMAVVELMREPIPDKMIIEKIVHKTVKCQLISEVSKNFSTLYLRKDDRFRLEKSLETFHSKKELFEELGLQCKLAILLHGLPGTGKSSTIIAAGTYLNKNLYYLNLNEVTSNEELQIMFDYVNKNCVGGGIIIFEDIDAMTKVVHRRDRGSGDSDEKRELTVAEVIGSKNDLTLEYFLNLIQGSLTTDNTVLIATTNHLETLDPAFYRDGRFDVKIEMKKCDRYQINMIYKNFFKREIPEHLLRRIKEDIWTPANIIFHIKNYLFSTAGDAEILDRFIDK